MHGFTLQKSMRFELDGVLVTVERILEDGSIWLESCKDRSLVQRSKEELLQAYLHNRIKVTSKAPQIDGIPIFGRPMSELSTEAQKACERRLSYINNILEEGRLCSSPNFLKPIIEKTAELIGDKKPPGMVTVYRWIKHYRKHDVRSLIPRCDLRGPKTTRLEKTVEELLDKCLVEVYSLAPRSSAKDIYAILHRKIEMENKVRSSSNLLKLPSIRTIQRLFQRRDKYDMELVQNGKHQANSKYRITGLGATSSRILERVEIDHTPLDLFLVDEKTWLPLGRPTLTILIDHSSRMILGYYIGFNGPSLKAVMRALKHAILPKVPATNIIPNLNTEHAWNCYGVMENLVMDNGMEFHAEGLENIAFALLIKLTFCPARSPRFKGVIERFMKTVNYSFAHRLPGTSLDRLFNRGDYDPQKHALITLGEFKQLLEKWILDVYAQDIHKTLKTTPWAKWQEGLKHVNLFLPNNASDLDPIMGTSVHRSLRHDGISLNGLQYSSPDLLPIMKKYGEGVRMIVVYDEDNLGKIWAWPPKSDDPIQVNATDSEYAEGLSYLQHKSIQDAIREAGKNNCDTNALLAAKADLAQAIQDMFRSRSLRKRKRAAKLSEINRSSAEPLPIAESCEKSSPKKERYFSDLQPEAFECFQRGSMDEEHAHE